MPTRTCEESEGKPYQTDPDTVAAAMILACATLSSKCPIARVSALVRAVETSRCGLLALMRSIKQHFDARGILNPGVFVGGI